MIAGSAQQLPAELPNHTAAVDADSQLNYANPSTADKARAKLDSEAGDDAAGDGAKPTGGIMELEDGVQHPLGGPKPDKPKSKPKRHIYNKEAVRVSFVDLLLCTFNRAPVLILVTQTWRMHHGCTFDHASINLLQCLVRYP